MSLKEDLKTVRDLISKHEPCSHQTSDFSLGDGKTWAKCEDCGITYHRETFERRAPSQMMAFGDAYDALDRIEKTSMEASMPGSVTNVDGALIAISTLLELLRPELEKIRNV